LRINNKKRLAFKSGFTLIELIATIGILAIVIAMAYSMENFGRASFNNGSVKSDIQSNTRLVANYITKELRYSSNVTILTTFPATADLIDNYKYIYIENGILKQYDNVDGINKGKITNILGNSANKISTVLNFSINDAKTVEFSVQETLKNQKFQLDSKVLLLNIGNGTLANGAGAVISYTTTP